MGFTMKSVPSIILLTVILMSLVEKGSAGMNCEVAFGVGFSCPIPFQDETKMYCCYNKNNIPYCCDFPDYIVSSTAIIAGVISGSVVLLLLAILCCCCCCSCCLLAKRRQSRGIVLYDPVARAPPPAAYPVAQPAPYPTQPVYPNAYPLHPAVHNPPPSYADQSQPPYNPGYPQN